MAFPRTQETVYVPGVSEVRSNDLNNFGAGFASGAHGDIVTRFGVNAGFVSSGAMTQAAHGQVAVGGGGANDWLDVDLDLPEGNIILDIAARVNQVGATPIAWQLGYIDPLSTAFVALVNEAGDATTGYKDVSQGMTHTLVAGRPYKLRIKSTAQAGDVFKSIAVTHYRP